MIKSTRGLTRDEQRVLARCKELLDGAEGNVKDRNFRLPENILTAIYALEDTNSRIVVIELVMEYLHELAND